MTADASADNAFPPQTREESLLYAALLARADCLNPYDGMVVLPQPWIVAKGRRFRPDYLVVMRSTLAVELDDPTHYGGQRFAADRSRDEILRDCGVPVLRVPLEDTFTLALLEDWVDRILARVRQYRPVG